MSNDMHSYLHSPISTAIRKQYEQLKWNAHVCLLGLKINKVSYPIKSLKEVMSSCMLRHIHHSKFPSLWRYGINWGGDTGTSCRQPCKGYTILTVTSLYVPGVICCVMTYKFSLEQNVHVHDYNTRKKIDLHGNSIIQ